MDLSNFNRFKAATWFQPDKYRRIIIGGAGGIGSWTALLMARAGFLLTVYDDDVLEQHNLSGQLYREYDVNMTKVEALSNLIQDFTGHNNVDTFNEKYEIDSPAHYFMIGAFDNMKARRDFFNNWKRFVLEMQENDEESLLNTFGFDDFKHPILIDGRLEMEQLQIFCVTPENMDMYEEEHLFDDSDVEDAVCSLKQTSHAAAMIASHITSFFTNHITNIEEGEVVREVPFYFEYFIPQNLTV